MHADDLKAKYAALERSDVSDIKVAPSASETKAAIVKEVKRLSTGVNTALELQATFSVALERLGGIDYLINLGKEHPQKFLQLLIATLGKGGAASKEASKTEASEGFLSGLMEQLGKSQGVEDDIN
jgi:predicted TIM-barrel fold metal-dependent hydrolase